MARPLRDTISMKAISRRCWCAKCFDVPRAHEKEASKCAENTQYVLLLLHWHHGADFRRQFRDTAFDMQAKWVSPPSALGHDTCTVLPRHRFIQVEWKYHNLSRRTICADDTIFPCLHYLQRRIYPHFRKGYYAGWFLMMMEYFGHWQ